MSTALLLIGIALGCAAAPPPDSTKPSAPPALVAPVAPVAPTAPLDENASAPAPPSIVARFDHVILVSVDGLHSGVLAAPMIDSIPAFARLMRGPHTLEARTDAESTVTLPNHVAMMTGLPARDHAWHRNDDPPGSRHGGTLHDRAGRYLPSVFDVAHDHGVSTALFAGKTKFWLFEQSYGAARGAPDVTGADDGKAKIDLFVFAEGGGALTEQLIARLERAAADGRRTLDVIHFAEPDNAGHAYEWDLTAGSKYLASLAEVDGWLARIFAALDGNEALRGRTAIVLTTDHGGGAPEKTHTDIEAPCNFTIPFLVWLGEDGDAADLYALNAERRARPSASMNPAVGAAPAPIRNGELGNVGLQLLGLPPIPGSTIGASPQLAVNRDAESAAGKRDRRD